MIKRDLNSSPVGEHQKTKLCEQMFLFMMQKCGRDHGQQLLQYRANTLCTAATCGFPPSWMFMILINLSPAFWVDLSCIPYVYIYIYRHICISFITYIYISYMCISCSASPYNTSISSYHLWLWGLWAARDIASRRASFWWMTWWPPQGWRVKVLHFGNLAGNPGWRWNLFLIHPGVKWREIIEELKTNRLTCHIDKQSTFIERHAVKCIFFA